MAGRKKTEWTLKHEALHKELPKGFRGQKFVGCKLNRDKIAEVCKKLGYKGKEDAVYAYLTHVASKAKSKGKKTVKGKNAKVTKKMQTIDLLSKKTYKNMSGEELCKLVAIIHAVQLEQRQNEIDRREKQINKLQKIVADI